jgi:predicted amidohydrolase YtcJ
VHQPSPEQTVLLEGRIFPSADQASPVEALAIRSGRVDALGTAAEVEAAADRKTERVRLGGRTVLPGLIDAHVHLHLYALGLDQVDCTTPTLEECLVRLKRRAGTAPPGSWVRGHGWDQNLWGRYGTLQELDGAVPLNPAFLTAKSLHSGWINSRALALAGISGSTPDPPGGRIERDAQGIPTGILFENALRLVSQVIGEQTPQALADHLQRAQSALWEFGLTGVHDFDGPQCLRALQILRQSGGLGLRVLKNLPVTELEHALALGLRSGFGDDWIRLGNIKLFADGALGPRTAAMFDAYQGEPDNIGMLLIDGEELAEIGIRAAEGGWALSVHAIGDRANHEVLDALSTVRAHERGRGAPLLRHRIEHLQVMHPDDLARPAELGVVASMQPIHALSDMAMAERFWGERTRHAYAWRAQLEAGARLAFGSDAPVESPNPFWGLHAAVGRRRLDGSPGPDGWHPQQKLQLREALSAYTLGPAYAAGWEGVQGQLRPGGWADLIVLDRDPFECEVEELAALKPVGTMVGGEWRFRKF